MYFVQFGDSQKLRLVRILRSTVMVRVGGGWCALDEFLVKNDPCRGKSIVTKHRAKYRQTLRHSHDHSFWGHNENLKVGQPNKPSSRSEVLRGVWIASGSQE